MQQHAATTTRIGRCFVYFKCMLVENQHHMHLCGIHSSLGMAKTEKRSNESFLYTHKQMIRLNESMLYTINIYIYMYHSIPGLESPVRMYFDKVQNSICGFKMQCELHLWSVLFLLFSPQIFIRTHRKGHE